MGQLFKFNPDKNLFASGSSFLPGGMSPADSFGLDLGDYNPLSGSSEGGASTGMDPLTAGLGIANLGASIFGGMAQRRTQANIANAQLAAAADQLKNQVEMTRDMTKFRRQVTLPTGFLVQRPGQILNMTAKEKQHFLRKGLYGN